MARKDITMSPGEIQAFFQEQMTLQVATNGKDGFPHVAPMWFVVEDEKLVFRSFTKSQKIVNLKRDPRIAVLVEDGIVYNELRGVSINGRAELTEDPERMLELARGVSAKMYPGLAGEALEQAAKQLTVKRTGVFIQPERIVSWDHRKLSGTY